ncbi:Putative protein [Zobellia galactanivorans]|uniref:Uncharacterized protein n=1 Tax=Zobellia galactanivorans (strain DSM 12802 / CCUG 47099 / CIP 106680 / NCIMB 13871 / Dsij) TaxID=63186 RepID=G0L519_ZOBGA|nr:Putative protein [Zobellia galactanivorans]
MTYETLINRDPKSRPNLTRIPTKQKSPFTRAFLFLHLTLFLPEGRNKLHFIEQKYILTSYTTNWACFTTKI